MIFDPSDGRPVLNTCTRDLSVGGAAIETEYADLTGSTITLLLAAPLPQPGAAPRLLRARASVVSTARTPGMQGYRHGLRFLRSPDDGLDVLATILGEGPAAAGPVQTAPACVPSADGKTAAPFAVPVNGGRLAQLRQLAEARLSVVEAPDPRLESNRRVSDALQRSHDYLVAVTEQLNLAKVPFRGRGYTIVGVPEFAGLAWESGRVGVRTKELSPGSCFLEQVTLGYLFSGERQLKLAREYPASEKLKKQLTDLKLEFSTHDKRNARGFAEQTTFSLACAVEASIVLCADFEAGRLLMKMRNVERFGTMDLALAPEGVDEAALDELVALVLGETNRISDRLLKAA